MTVTNPLPVNVAVSAGEFRGSITLADLSDASIDHALRSIGELLQALRRSAPQVP